MPLTTKNRVTNPSKWSSNLAYAVGLIVTDGYLSPDKRHITFTSADVQLIQTLKSCLKIDNRITLNPRGSLSKKQVYRLQFGDTKLYQFLNSIGITTNKSLVLGKIDIPNKYFPDFLRGLLDGDGSIIVYTDRYNTKLKPKYVYTRLFTYFISASEKHVMWLQSKITRLIKIHGSVNKMLSKSQMGKQYIYRLKFSTNDSKMLLNWIYYKNNLPCLMRKYKKAKNFLEVK